MNFQDTQSLKIFLKESARWHHEALHEYLVGRARELDLAGATVIRASTGFGAGEQIHTTKLLSLSEDLPIVLEIVDRSDRIDAFLDANSGPLAGCFLTLTPVKSLRLSKSL